MSRMTVDADSSGYFDLKRGLRDGLSSQLDLDLDLDLDPLQLDVGSSS